MLQIGCVTLHPWTFHLFPFIPSYSFPGFFIPWLFHPQHFQPQHFQPRIFILALSSSHFHPCTFILALSSSHFKLCTFIPALSSTHFHTHKNSLKIFIANPQSARTQMLGSKYLDINMVTNVNVLKKLMVGTSEHSFKSVNKGR